jgi:hypothetical protein
MLQCWCCAGAGHPGGLLWPGQEHHAQQAAACTAPRQLLAAGAAQGGRFFVTPGMLARHVHALIIVDVTLASTYQYSLDKVFRAW